MGEGGWVGGVVRVWVGWGVEGVGGEVRVARGGEGVGGALMALPGVTENATHL